MHSDERDDEEEAPPDVPVTTVDLVIEVMGRLSNIILVSDDGTVMEAVKRITPSINRYRTTLPNHRYVPPPPQEKREPRHVSPNILSVEMSRAAEAEPNAPAWQGLVAGFSGISPTLAREIVYGALGDVAIRAQEIATQPAPLEKIARELAGLLKLEETGAWEPTLAWRETSEGILRAVDFAPYSLTHLEAQGARLEHFESISDATSHYFEALQSLGGHSALQVQAHAQLRELRLREERRLYALHEQLERAVSAEELRRKGEYLLAYMHTLEPGQTVLTLPEEELSIELDPSLSPVENAQSYFKEYGKARSAQEGLPELVRESEVRLAFLDELATSLDLAQSYDDIRAVQADIALAASPSAGGKPQENGDSSGKQGKKGRAQKKQEKLPQPLRLRTQRGVPLLVGRTAQQNDAVTFRLAAPEDLWFHARNIPGSHVVLRVGGVEVSEEDIAEAAGIAAAYSASRNDAQVDVVYTEKRYVRKIANAPPGMVTYRNEQVIRVAPRQATVGERG
jgi:predicted ribosome quality control (RQC) complex YloA/Tae2 family protein